MCVERKRVSLSFWQQWSDWKCDEEMVKWFCVLRVLGREAFWEQDSEPELVIFVVLRFLPRLRVRVQEDYILGNFTWWNGGKDCWKWLMRHISRGFLIKKIIESILSLKTSVKTKNEMTTKLHLWQFYLKWWKGLLEMKHTSRFYWKHYITLVLHRLLDFSEHISAHYNIFFFFFNFNTPQ